MRSLSHVRSVAPSTRWAVTLCLLVHGACANVDGGAVELSWKLRPASGSNSGNEFISCKQCENPGEGEVAKIRIDWDVEGVHGFKVFCCKDGHGVTGFDLPPGIALLSVTPICSADRPADPDTYTAPAPEERRVITGNTVSLGAVELILKTESICR